MSDPDMYPEMEDVSRGGGCGKPLLIGCGILLFLFVGASATLAVLVSNGTIAFQEPTPIRGEEVPEHLMEDLREIALEEGETVAWFSGVKFWMLNPYGSVLTDRRVIFYEMNDSGAGDLYDVSAIALEDVRGLDADFGVSNEEETTVTVYSAGDDGALQVEVGLILIAIDGLDHEFVEAIVAAARGAGAELEAIRFGGSVTDAEIAAVEGAVRMDAEGE